jgi:MFS family permease
MVASFKDVPDGEEGVYVGLLASAFALAQLTTNLFWGYMSDTVGRKPVMLLGTLLLGICFAFFGFCQRYSHLIAVHIAMGLLNGNAAVVPTCLGEVTDRSNQSRAFIWLPVMYSIGSITGPAVGGLMVRSEIGAYPFLAPNIVSAALLFASVAVLAIWFDETREWVDEEAREADLDRAEHLFGCLCFGRRNTSKPGGWKSRWLAKYRRDGGSEARDEGALSPESNRDADMNGENESLLPPQPRTYFNGYDRTSDGGDPDSEQKSAFRELANRTTVAVLITYLFFQLSNISFNSLYPIFASAPTPTGRDLDPGTIGLSLSFAGLATMLFQVSLFEPLKARVGNLGTYRASLLGIAISMALMPWIGHRDERPWLGLGTGKTWLYAELGIVLVLKNICAVGGLSSVMLLVSNFVSPTPIYRGF